MLKSEDPINVASEKRRMKTALKKPGGSFIH